MNRWARPISISLVQPLKTMYAHRLDVISLSTHSSDYVTEETAVVKDVGSCACRYGGVKVQTVTTCALYFPSSTHTLMKLPK